MAIEELIELVQPPVRVGTLALGQVDGSGQLRPVLHRHHAIKGWRLGYCSPKDRSE
jgi:hypothetical protein